MDANAANSDRTVCPRCGGPVSRHSPRGLCRRCIARVTLPQSEKTRPAETGLRVRCPQCGHAIELAEGTGLSDIRCDSCGTHFNIVDDQAASQTAARLDRVGQFEILEKLGTGAFGTVWKARDTRLDRLVAIKIPRQRRLEPAEVEKFLREARAAAQLRHPNIVSVFEVGREDDLIYIVCDFVEGVSLAEWLTGKRVSPREAARLCRKIASALEHAHEQGVIHRDIKPGNILLDAKGEPHLTDFGLARRDTGEVTLTLDGQLLGTPAYMSPEQAKGEAHQADSRTDTYSLGVVLFQLLTGELPFRGSTRMLIHQVIHDDPPSPRKLNAHVPRDLETICLKCLEKEPGRRYDSAHELGEELDRFLRDEPIRARPLSTMGKTWRWCRRKPVLAAMTAAVAMSLLTVTVVSVTSAWRIATARKGEQREAYYSNIALANQYIEQGSIDRALETLWKCPEQYRHWEWGHLLYLCHQDAASFLAQETSMATVLFTPDARSVVSEAVTFSPDSRWVVSQDVSGVAKVWDWQAEQQVFGFGSSSNRAGSIAFHPSGGQLAAAMGTNGVSVWATTNWQQPTKRQLELAVPSEPHSNQPLTRPSDTLSPSDGERAGVRGRSAISQDPQPLLTLRPQGGEVTTLAYSPDGRLIANCPFHEGVIIRSARSGRELLRIHAPNECSLGVAFSPDSRRLVTGGTHKTAKVWDLETGQLLLRLGGHLRQAAAVAYSSNGRRIATGSQDGTAKVWDAHTGQELLTLPMDPQKGYALTGLSNIVSSLAFDAQGERLLIGGTDGKARIWEVGTGRLLRTLDPGKRTSWMGGYFLPDQRHVITTADNLIQVWEASTGRLVTQATGRGVDWAMALSRDGRRWFVASVEGLSSVQTGSGHSTLEVWDIEQSPRRILEFPGSGLFTSLELSPDDRTVACAALDMCVHWWESFPWREDEYGEVRGQKSEVGGQRTEIRSRTEFADRVRQYARRYWRERLEMELNGVEGEPAKPRVTQMPLDRALFAKRDPRATANQIDLTDFYTGELGETFQGKVGATNDHDDDLSELPIGLVKLDGVEFEIRGVIQIRRTELLGGPWELARSDDVVRVDAIPVQQEAARLHLLLGTSGPEAEGTVIGRLMLHYADGETRPLDRVYGRDVREWWYDPAQTDAETTDRAKVVWTGLNPVANEYGRRLRLYLNTRDNPRPGVKIMTFDFVSAMSNSAPFLIAVTVE